MKWCLFLIMLIALTSQSCRIFYPNQIFKTPEGYDYTKFDSMPHEEYRIVPGDKFTMQVFSNDNYNTVNTIVPTFEGGRGGSMQQGQIPYLVKQDSMSKLPVLGEVQLTGMTEPEAERYLEEQYSLYYEEPFVRLQVTNRRVVLFNSGAGSGKIVTLNEQNMSLIEVLAKAGGIPGGAKAYEVKVIRGDLNDPDIALLDLSTLEGMREASLKVQANDIIYIETRTRVTSGVLRELSPILSLISSLATLYFLINNLTRNQ